MPKATVSAQLSRGGNQDGLLAKPSFQAAFRLPPGAFLWEAGSGKMASGQMGSSLLLLPWRKGKAILK